MKTHYQPEVKLQVRRIHKKLWDGRISKSFHSFSKYVQFYMKSLCWLFINATRKERKRKKRNRKLFETKELSIYVSKHCFSSGICIIYTCIAIIAGDSQKLLSNIQNKRIKIGSHWLWHTTRFSLFSLLQGVWVG